MVRPPTMACVSHVLSSATAFMNVSVIRTEWFAFWNWTES